jgi:hypothetical protein
MKYYLPDYGWTVQDAQELPEATTFSSGEFAAEVYSELCLHGIYAIAVIGPGNRDLGRFSVGVREVEVKRNAHSYH